MARLNIKALVGAGDKIGRAMLPLIVVGVIANILWPELFSVGGPGQTLFVISVAVLAVGVVFWLWSVVLILTRVPKHELITNGPYALVKHPLYTAVGLLVLPTLGFLLNTWLGLVIGVALYLVSRRYAPAEEESLASEFGPEWDAYVARVMLPWV
jgi:protein-S-isoprenylcysteine O-methyltransferase Ste14